MNDCSNLIGPIRQIKVTAEFPDARVPTDVSALGKAGENSSVKALAFEKMEEKKKRRRLNWNGLCQSAVYPLVFTTRKKKVIDIYIPKGKGEETLEPARSEASSLSPLNIPAALEGQRGSANSRAGERAGETEAGARGEAGIKSACWKKQDGHKRWTKLQRGLFLSKANGNISTQHREPSAGSIITAEQTQLAAIPEERRDAARWPGLAPSARPPRACT